MRSSLYGRAGRLFHPVLISGCWLLSDMSAHVVWIKRLLYVVTQPEPPERTIKTPLFN